MIDTILQGDVRSCLKQLEDGSVQCVITSPPYWGLRDYGTATWEGGDPNCDHMAPPTGGKTGSTLEGNKQRGTWSADGQYRQVCLKCGARRIDSQIGLEPTPEAYVADLVEVFREVKRVLRNDGVLWLNLGDSYGGAKDAARHDTEKMYGKDSEAQTVLVGQGRLDIRSGVKPKDLVGIPWMVAFALRADGWYLRSDIIWNKPNPMPESVTDRCTKSHEDIFMLTKSERYYYDAEAISEGVCDAALSLPQLHGGGQRLKEQKDKGAYCLGNTNGRRNKRDVWTVTTQHCTEAHFATFPPKLIEPMILAGTKEGDTILDPFMGSGTTAIQAVRWHRHYLGCELNSDYVKMAERRIADMVGPLFEVAA